MGFTTTCACTHRSMLEALSRCALQVVHATAEFSVEELVFGCRTPLIHPFLSARLRELVQLPEALPLKERKVILYLSRQSGTSNGGRKVIVFVRPLG